MMAVPVKIEPGLELNSDRRHHEPYFSTNFTSTWDGVLNGNFEVYQCGTCDLIFACSIDLREHAKTHNVNDSQKFHFPKAHVSSSSLNSSDVSLICNAAGYGNMFLQTNSVDGRMYIRTQEENDAKEGENVRNESKLPETYTCDLCEKSFTEMCHLQKHLHSHGELKPHACSTCGKRFNHLSSCQRHIITHANSKPFQCGICDRMYAQTNQLLLHMTTHSSKLCQCTMCDKAFAIPRHLRSHMRIHTGEKPHTCLVCSRSFSHLSSYRRHMLSHTGEKMQRCMICERTFPHATSLRSHMLIHQGERSHLCLVCGKTFLRSSNLNSHMKIHAIDYPHECTICDRSFKHLTSYRRHMLTHTGEKQEQCHVCNRIFPQMTSLKSHMLMHDGERSHLCTVCGKSFLRTSNLNSHMKTHMSTGELYQCSVCDRTFTWLRSLQRHMKSHGQVKFQPPDRNMSGNVLRINNMDTNIGEKLYEASAFDLFVAKTMDSHVNPTAPLDSAGFKVIEENERDETVSNDAIGSSTMAMGSDEHTDDMDEENGFEFKEKHQSDDEMQV